MQFCNNKEDFLKKIGITLKSIRVKQNKSQEEIALQVGVDRSYISLLEKGKRNPTIYTLCKICSALGVSILDLWRYLNKNE